MVDETDDVPTRMSRVGTSPLPSLLQSDHVHGEVELEQVPVEAAISGVIYQVIEEGKTVADAADQAVLQHLRAVAPTFSKSVHDVAMATPWVVGTQCI